MRKKDKTEKALENYNDVFADIVNALVFDGDQIIKGTELEQVLPKELLHQCYILDQKLGTDRKV